MNMLAIASGKGFFQWLLTLAGSHGRIMSILHWPLALECLEHSVMCVIFIDQEPDFVFGPSLTEAGV